MNFSTQNQNLSYFALQKQLDDEHRRLMHERQSILAKQHQKLQLYEKIDLAEFFNYQPKQSQQSKQEIMYHLTAKFRDYMRKLTENNVYKQMGHLVHDQPDSQKSRSKNKQKTNVQKNSDLGRMFQTMRAQKNQCRQSNFQRQVNNLNENINLRLINQPQRLSIHENRNERHPTIKRRLLLEPDRYCQSRQGSQIENLSLGSPSSNSNCLTDRTLLKQDQINVSIQQLSQTLNQQQKIYLLSQLNYYIKLFKQSELKRVFMQKHLNNLHQYLIDVKFEKKSPEISQHSEKNFLFLQSQNELFKRQIGIYKQELQSLKKFENQNYYAHSQINSSPRAFEIRKIDRFKEFSSHIHIMQSQLAEIIRKVNSQINYSKPHQLQSTAYVRQLQSKVQKLESYIENEDQKKERFFEEVNTFKELMKQKDAQISILSQQVNKLELLLDRNTKAKHQNEQIQSKHNQRSKLISKSMIPASKKGYKQNDLSRQNCQLTQLDRFIDIAFKNCSSAVQTPSSFCKYRKLQVKEPFQNLIRGSKIDSHRNEEIKPVQLKRYSSSSFINGLKQNSDSKTAENSRFMDFTPSSTSKRNFDLNSQDRHSEKSKQRSRIRIRTDQMDSYEPKPYQRYNRFYDQQSMGLSTAIENEQNSLYHRITESSRQKSKSKHSCRI